MFFKIYNQFILQYLKISQSANISLHKFHIKDLISKCGHIYIRNSLMENLFLCAVHMVFLFHQNCASKYCNEGSNRTYVKKQDIFMINLNHLKYFEWSLKFLRVSLLWFKVHSFKSVSTWIFPDKFQFMILQNNVQGKSD